MINKCMLVFSVIIINAMNKNLPDIHDFNIYITDYHDSDNAPPTSVNIIPSSSDSTIQSSSIYCITEAPSINKIIPSPYVVLL